MPISATGAQGTNECYGAVLEPMPISAAGAAPNSMPTVMAKESMFKVDARIMPMPMSAALGNCSYFCRFLTGEVEKSSGNVLCF